MKWMILTTDTLHHAWFIREAAKAFPLHGVLLERNSLKAPFETAHPMERLRDDYERDAWFGGEVPALESLAPTRAFDSINDPAAAACLREASPDLVVVFGTGRIGPDLIAAAPRGALLNLHGGDPREYRGLDSHLWAVYHSDFGGLVTTLHHLNADLDDGDIVSQGAIPLVPAMELHQLRRANTGVCVRLVLSALDMLARFGGFPSVPQSRRGRYYSFMPASLKEICRKRFHAHTRRLADG